MANQIFPTKGNLIASKKSLDLADMGYDLLDKKRNVLITEMMTTLDDVRMIRSQITDAYAKAYKALEMANVSRGLIDDLVETIDEDQGLSVTYKSIMGVEIPKITYEKQDLFDSYHFNLASSQVDEALSCFNEVKELTVKLAEVENTVYRLANAIRNVSKRTNALKNISIPNLESTIKFISDSLEEKEREEFSRQKVIKAQKLKKE